jgi:hypothetical protein
MAFFAALTGSLSHQINNVFAILGELNGLVEDLLSAANEDRAIPRERLGPVVDKIGRNVSRGTEYVKLLNRLSHAANGLLANADLRDVLHLFTGLSARMLELKQVKMILDIASASVPVTTSTFTLIHLLFLCLQVLLEAGPGQGTIQLEVRVESRRPILRLQGTAPVAAGPASESRQDLLDRLVAELGASLRYDGRGDRPCFEITLPA